MPFDCIPLAMDRSVRRYDQDGRLHVAVSHLTKACVNGYRGNEIPGFQQLGLNPGQTYMLLRDPAELSRAVPTFNNVPVLDQHIPVTASDERRERVIGSTGTDAAWRAPYLDNSLVFWSDHAIAMIESGEMRELSSAYRYVPVMTPGNYQGVRYDGVMTEIRANHIALVEAGRAGDDVVVMDSKPKEKPMRLSSYAAFIAGSTNAYLTPLMAQDQKPPDLKKMLLGTTSKNWKAKRPEFEAAVTRALKGRLAQDAEVHIHEHLDGAGAEAPPDDVAPGDPNGMEGAVPGQEDDDDQGGAGDDDLAAKVQQLLQGQIDDNDLAIILHALKEVKPPDLANGNGGGDPPANGNGASGDDDPVDKKPPLAATDEDDVADKIDSPRMKDTPAMDGKRFVTVAAMDAAIQKKVNEATKATTVRLNARAEAERFVRPWVGEIAVAMDSADEVYKFALEQSGEDVTGIHPSAFKALLTKVPRPGEEQHRPSPMAMDKAGTSKYLERFPNANRLRAH